jgi:hypothetical protein
VEVQQFGPGNFGRAVDLCAEPVKDDAMSLDLKLTMSATLPMAGLPSWTMPPPGPSPAELRTEAWMAWMEDVRRKLLRAKGQGAFFAHHWAMHSPTVGPVASSPAMEWTLDRLRAGKASDVEVEVQAGRLSDADYERRSHDHKRRIRFGEFLDLVESGPANDVYMTANNTAANAALLEVLADDLCPLPPMLQPEPRKGFLWIGRDTMTPMHHDLTQNIMVQLVGTKVIRLVPPSEQPKLGNSLHVFADFRWLEDELAKSRDIAFTEVVLPPRHALFLPVGWWHCVRAQGFSVTYTSTNFWWPNDWTEGFP